MGIPVAHDVQPEDVLYYVKAMLMVFANHGNFKNRGKARTRYMPAEMGGAEAFIKTYEETLAMVKEVEQLRINPADYAYEITKTGKTRRLCGEPSYLPAKTRRSLLCGISSSRW